MRIRPHGRGATTLSTMNGSSRPVIAPGDRVRLRKDGPGTVVAVIGEDNRNIALATRSWERLGRGIVVRLDSGSLVHIREPLFELITPGC